MKVAGLILTGALLTLAWSNRPAEAPASQQSASPKPVVLDCFERAVRIAYRSEEGDYWQSPSETVRRGEGDCEDKALYLHDLLTGHGYAPQVVFGVEDALQSDGMHAWVELEVNGQRYVLDPTNGFVARRENLSGRRHMPVLGLPKVMRKLDEYRSRTGASGINEHYEYALARLQGE